MADPLTRGPPLFVIGTAGHIDHGKSALVKALTGTDPDRLREEKERGMTIDLGFAWFRLPSGREVAIVDVPGHERFVKNMLAGVGAIDLALLVVAANEGVMPQTKEHLAILDLLAVPRAVAVLNKKDLVDAEWLALVKMDVEELLAKTHFAGSPVVAVSSVTGDGLPELVSLVDRLLGAVGPRRDLGRPRLAIDRVFTITGAGTVVTGMLIDGTLSVGQEVEIVPSGLKTRVRGLQTHKAPVEMAVPGSRVAANIVGVSTGEVRRGDVLTRPGWLAPAGVLTAKLRLLPHLERPLRHAAEVSFHSGTAEEMAKVRVLEKDEVRPGETGWVQLTLEEPVALVDGDHFIIRSTMDTLGGGEVVSTEARRLRRFRPEVIRNLEDRGEGTSAKALVALLETRQPQELAALVSQSNLPGPEARSAVEALLDGGDLVSIGQDEHRLLWTKAGWERLRGLAISAVEEYHRRNPTRSGMPKVELGSRLKLGAAGGVAVEKLSREGLLVEQGAVVRLPSHEVKLSAAQQAKIEAYLAALASNPYSPPGEATLEPELLNLLVEQRRVVKAGALVFLASAYDEMVAKTVALVKQKGKVTLAEVRDLFNTSRRYAQAFLEHLDEKKVTRRVGDERVLWR